jgi:hypothetical protein
VFFDSTPNVEVMPTPELIADRRRRLARAKREGFLNGLAMVLWPWRSTPSPRRRVIRPDTDSATSALLGDMNRLRSDAERLFGQRSQTRR